MLSTSSASGGSSSSTSSSFAGANRFYRQGIHDWLVHCRTIVWFLFPVCSFSLISHNRFARTISWRLLEPKVIWVVTSKPAANDDTPSVETFSYLFNGNDDDDDDDDYLSSRISSSLASPFQTTASLSPSGTSTCTSVDDPIALTVQNVDLVLNEVRPYLIADGGNVAVKRVDEVSGTVYLKLEGACGSCPSSTVTMKMGIERVLKENFPNFKEVQQVDDDSVEQNHIDSLVKKEMNRLSPAISALGGKMELLRTDADAGVVTIKYRGSNKIRQGLELALLDLASVNKVEFVMGDD